MITMKKNKKTKAALYQNLYPVNLYVSTLDDWDDITNFFDFFNVTKELLEDEPVKTPKKPAEVGGVTYLVREKDTRSVGVLIVLSDGYMCSTLAHESIHYADAVYDYLRMNAEGYDDGNEQYAYLVSWCVDSLYDYLEWKERKTTKKTTKQDGN